MMLVKEAPGLSEVIKGMKYHITDKSYNAYSYLAFLWPHRIN